MYAAAASMVVVAGYFVMGIFAETVKTMHRHSLENARRKKEQDRARR